MGSEEDSKTRTIERAWMAKKHREEAESCRRIGGIMHDDLAAEHERAARLIEADPEPLIAAIRALTLDMPDGTPNGPAERWIKALGDYLKAGDVNRATGAYVLMCEAMSEDTKRLREAADAYFGGDFSKQEDK